MPPLYLPQPVTEGAAQTISLFKQGARQERQLDQADERIQLGRDTLNQRKVEAEQNKLTSRLNAITNIYPKLSRTGKNSARQEFGKLMGFSFKGGADDEMDEAMLDVGHISRSKDVDRREKSRAIIERLLPVMDSESANKVKDNLLKDEKANQSAEDAEAGMNILESLSQTGVIVGDPQNGLSVNPDVVADPEISRQLFEAGKLLINNPNSNISSLGKTLLEATTGIGGQVTKGTTAVQQESIFSKIQDDARQHANSVVPKAGASFSFGDESVSFTGGGRDVEAWETARDKFLNEQVNNAVNRGNLNKSFLEGLSEPLPTPTPQTFTTKDGSIVTQADISFTAQQENISEDEVKKRLGIE